MPTAREIYDTMAAWEHEAGFAGKFTTQPWLIRLRSGRQVKAYQIREPGTSSALFLEISPQPQDTSEFLVANEVESFSPEY